MNPRILLFALALAAVPFAAGAVLPERERPAVAPADGLLVKYRPGVTAQQIHLHADSLGIEMIREPGVRSGALGKLRVPQDQHELRLRELNASGLVEYAEPNYRRFPHNMPNDDRYDEQWAMVNLAMEAAWAIQTGSDTVRIAIIDNGVDSSHPDLAGNVIPGQCFGPDDFCTGAENGDPQSSEDAHGTLVAGQAGAVGNNVEGITGTAWKVELLPLRTDLTVEYIRQAIEYAIANDVHIINASYGGASFSQVEKDAVAAAGQAGILFVTSAGNSHTDNDKGMLSFPQTFDLDNVLTVAASDQLDQLTTWAQYGQTTVDVAAGGLGIVTTNAGVASGGEYVSASGSSFASPMIAGIAALIRSESGDIAGFQEMKARIVAGAQMTDGLRGRVAGGRANAANALTWDLDNDPVLVIESIAVDDAADGNGNAALDAGETADLLITVRSLWGAASGLDATLTAPVGPSSIAIGDGGAQAALVPHDGSAELRIPVSVADGFVGNERTLFRLDLTWDDGGQTTRWFEHELGVLARNASHQFSIGRGRHDNFHAFHVDVPAGVTDFRVTTETRNEYDIDLLVRPGEPPQYQINLGEGPDSDNAVFAYHPDDDVDDKVLVSGRFDGNESLTWDAPEPGTYHVVIVNYGLERQAYRISTSWCTNAGCPGRLRFSSAVFTGDPSRNAMTVTVVRDGGALGAVSVDYRSAIGGTAVPGTDYTSVSGTLEWADGDLSAKTFELPLASTRTEGRTVVLELRGSAGATLMTPSWAVATLPGVESGGGGGGGGNGGGGGGGSIPWWLVAGLAGLAVFRRTRPA